ncbi:MAG: hypothetical protein AB7J13_00695 [Pyrinomonadaceae bacterium]
MIKFSKGAIYLTVSLGIVIIFFGHESWAEFTLTDSKMSMSMAIATLIMLGIVLTVYYRLKYWHIWTIVLVFLALFGSGLELPPFFVLFPDHVSTGRVALTLAAVLLFWGIEKLVDNSVAGGGYWFVGSDDLITLNLDDQKETIPQHR